jgi:alpha-beta hydrolase superfamily lysophospholipase
MAAVVKHLRLIAHDGVPLIVRDYSQTAWNDGETFAENSAAVEPVDDIPVDPSWLEESPSIPAEPQPCRGAIVVVHGVCEHSGRYGHVAARCVARGWRFLVFDLRGHGYSGGPRTHVDTMSTYLADVRSVVTACLPRGLPVVLLGHSFGGLLAIRCVQAEALPEPPLALVLSAPLLGIRLHVPPWKHWLGQALVRVLPRVRFRTGVRAENMTRDPRFLDRRRADPQIQRAVTAGWFFAMVDALKLAHAETDRVRLPVYVVQGDADETTDPTAPAEWLARIASREPQLRIYPGHVHELFQEADWATTVASLLEWLESVSKPVNMTCSAAAE